MQELAPFAPRLPKKSAFTLAEILITFAIIGIVATVVIPTFVNNFNNHVYNEKKINILYKFNKITENMNSNNLIGPYNSTEDFVFNLQRFMKIAQVCNSSNIADCWPTKTIKTTDNNDFDVSNLKTGKNFGTDGYTNSMMGIVSADGTPFILTYKDECPQLSSETVYPWTVEGGKPTVNATSQCVAMMFDINGAKGPNKVGKDILATGNVTQIGGGCAGVELSSGLCVDTMATLAAVYKENYYDVHDSGFLDSINADTSLDVNYYLGAYLACEENGKRIITYQEMNALITESGYRYNTSYAIPKSFFTDLGLSDAFTNNMMYVFNDIGKTTTRIYSIVPGSTSVTAASNMTVEKQSTPAPTLCVSD